MFISTTLEYATNKIQALATKKDELAELKHELDQKTADLNEIRAIEIEMKNKLDENHKVLSENQKRFRYWSDKLSKLSIQSVRYIRTTHHPQRILIRHPAISVKSKKPPSSPNTPKTSSVT